MSLKDNFYLNRYQFRQQAIFTNPQKDLELVIVIPSFKEPHLLNSLNALYACDRPNCSIEVIVVINCSEIGDEAIQQETIHCYNQAVEWAHIHNNHPTLQFYILLENQLPKKHAGVGLARKIGMDEAVRRFELINNSEGVIVCFDADSLCEKNYFIALQKHFQEHPQTTACALHFEHPLSGSEDQWIYEGIINYELHLRYYVNILKYAGYPDAYQTIGSSMAARSKIYQKLGGMNRRKAGEDFYFLHKIIPLGNFTELKTTKVIPSPRVSDRVPFGTGKAIGDFMKQENRNTYYTYNVQSFLDLKVFLKNVQDYYTYTNKDIQALLSTLPQSIQQYLIEIKFEENLPQIQRQSKTLETFINRFFLWFNGLVILKYVHYTRDHFYANQKIEEAIDQLCNLLQIKRENHTKNMLLNLRKHDLKFS